jgi:competence protein ComEA
MSMPDPSSPPSWSLHRADQIALASLAAIAWIFLGLWFFRQGALIEIDRAEPLTAHFQVDLNTADRQELMQLPGIGPKLADRIVASRDSEGLFARCEDLTRVPGIGPRIFERIRPYLRIGHAVSAPAPTGSGSADSLLAPWK